MSNFLLNSVYFGVLISIVGYLIGVFLKKKLHSAIFNPLLVSIIITIIAVLALGIDYDAYYDGAYHLSYLLTPATVCLAIPLYERIGLLKDNFKAVIGGIVSGVITSLTSVLVLCLLFGLGHREYVTLLPKSITTAIGMGVSEKLGGYVTITVAVIVVTGVFGNMVASTVCKVFRIEEPIAKGIGIGSASHAIGTTRAFELGEVEGAMSSLSIAVSGIITVVFASIFSMFM